MIQHTPLYPIIVKAPHRVHFMGTLWHDVTNLFLPWTHHTYTSTLHTLCHS